MKATRWMAVMLLVMVCAIGWGLFVGDGLSETRMREESVSLARENRAQKLYQLAEEAYQKALTSKPEIVLYDELLDTLEEHYAEERVNSVKKDLVAAYEAAVFAFPEQTEFWERYVQMHLNTGNYSAAAAVLKKADAAGASGEGLEALSQTVFYAYEVIRRGFVSITPAAVEGCYVAQDGDGWGVVDAYGADVLPFVYTGAGLIGEDQMMLVTSADGEIRLLDEDGVMQARIPAVAAEIGACGDGLIPVRLEGREDWCYLDKTGKELFGGFRKAGAFRKGTAAVQMSDGKWCLIGTDGQQSSENTWDEVLLAQNGSHVHDSRVLLKTDGQWRIYSKSGSEVEGFACDAIDGDFGEAIAFCRGGKWGFVDEDGNVVIEPVYDDARSFSGGVGAVCRDGLWGFVDESGQLVVEYTFAEAGYFNEEGTCVIRMPEAEEYRLIQWCAEH